MKKLFLITALLISTQAEAMFTRAALAAKTAVPAAQKVVTGPVRFAHCHRMLNVSEDATKGDIEKAYSQKMQYVGQGALALQAARRLAVAKEQALQFRLKIQERREKVKIMAEREALAFVLAGTCSVLSSSLVAFLISYI